MIKKRVELNLKSWFAGFPHSARLYGAHEREVGGATVDPLRKTVRPIIS